MSTSYRIEKDSMGEIKVPSNALYSAQTQRAVENFHISGIRFSPEFIRAVALIKKACASANKELGLLDADLAHVIETACDEIAEGRHEGQFPLDIFQTGSGTSTNMNTNEVIATRANQLLAEQGNKEKKVHPNDHVNFGQSSNDVIPTAIRVAAACEATEKLIPALQTLHDAFMNKGKEYAHVVKTGRTHLMDAMPVTIEQEFGGYARQIALGIQRVESALPRLLELPQGGTAVGTGINTHADFGAKVAALLADYTGLAFREAENHFEAQATVDAPVDFSAQLKTVAIGMLKISNDLRWMNSGPNSGIGEIQLAALQPGSSIMPGKVNPVIEESTNMICAQVIGNDAAIGIAGINGNFELNVMLPVVAHNLLQSIRILANGAVNWAELSVNRITVREAVIKQMVSRNPILVTALNPIIGYDLAAKIAKKAFAEDRPLKDVALEMTNMTSEELDKALDPIKMTKGGFTD
ncbi:MAG: class II fumarate hydratase [Balneolales bacterium]|nr:class II fumarate hydratase [Balneolales bacterium]